MDGIKKTLITLNSEKIVSDIEMLKPAFLCRYTIFIYILDAATGTRVRFNHTVGLNVTLYF